MNNSMIEKALGITMPYLKENYSQAECGIIITELEKIIGNFETSASYEGGHTYESLQRILSNINEKEDIRREKGVYYTPNDIVDFTLMNAAKLACGRLNEGNIHVMDLNGIPYTIFCYEKTVFDPTCGTGEFLLAALNKKFDLLELHHNEITSGKIKKVIATIFGNDTNKESIEITSLRFLLCVAHRYGAQKVIGLAEILLKCFKNYDYVTEKAHPEKYDVLIGNPPYVEDGKSGLVLSKKYGNIYANVLYNAAMQLNPDGVIAFVVPLSYVSTPRMKTIREDLSKVVQEQFVLSYSDRPDCLFTSVHQKLCLLFGKNTGSEISYYTGNYTYWYKEERESLFRDASTVKNPFVTEEYIPKVGTAIDVSVYNKIMEQSTSISTLLDSGSEHIYLNMRAAFWIKAFLGKHETGEYKAFGCETAEMRNYAMCLLNSSLFWWYWICVSDCWHITKKELAGFKIPALKDSSMVSVLAENLEKKLEETKVYVGTKQVDYEYKHKECVKEIHEIDDLIAKLYKLTDEEALYIRNFAYRYRISGGAKNGRN